MLYIEVYFSQQSEFGVSADSSITATTVVAMATYRKFCTSVSELAWVHSSFSSFLASTFIEFSIAVSVEVEFAEKYK